jgi:choline dehydrogenase-like flavoprotein
VQQPAVASITDDIRAMSARGRLVAIPVEARKSDDAIDEWLTQNARDDVHAVGTCRMGTPATLPRSSIPTAG